MTKITTMNDKPMHFSLFDEANMQYNCSFEKAASILNVNIRTIRRWVKTGFPSVQLDYIRIKLSKKEIPVWIKQHSSARYFTFSDDALWMQNNGTSRTKLITANQAENFENILMSKDAVIRLQKREIDELKASIENAIPNNVISVDFG